MIDSAHGALLADSLRRTIFPTRSTSADAAIAYHTTGIDVPPPPGATALRARKSDDPPPDPVGRSVMPTV
jgi:hypothetical protein